MQISRAAARPLLPCRQPGLASPRSCTQKLPRASATCVLCAAFWPKELREKTPICPYYLASHVSAGSVFVDYTTHKKCDFIHLFYPSSPVGDTASRRLDESRGAAEEAGWSPTAPARCGGLAQSNTGPLRPGHGRELHHPVTTPARDGRWRHQPSFIPELSETTPGLEGWVSLFLKQGQRKALMGSSSPPLSMWKLKPACSSETVPTPPLTPAVSVQGLKKLTYL